MKRIINFLELHSDILVLGFGLVAALAVRLMLRGYITGDAVTGFLPWYEYIKSQGGIPALGHGFSGYSPLYLYMLTLSELINRIVNISELTIIKLIPIAFDFFGAYWFAKIVRLRYPRAVIGYLAALAYLFLPTVFINSSMWGQIDGIYTALLLPAIYFLLKNRNIPAMIFFGLALSIKFQAIFWAPVLLVLFLCKRIHIKYFLIVPAVYILTILPAWILGRDFWELLTLFFNQVGSFDALTLNAPTIYALIDGSVNYLFNPVGVLLGLVITATLAYAISILKPNFDSTIILHLSACAVLLVPFILPKMHERYFFLAEVLSLLLVFYRPRLAFIPAVLQITAFSTYNNYLFGYTFLSLPMASLINLAVIIYLGYDLAKVIRPTMEQPQIQPGNISA